MPVGEIATEPLKERTSNTYRSESINDSCMWDDVNALDRSKKTAAMCQSEVAAISASWVELLGWKPKIELEIGGHGKEDG